MTGAALPTRLAEPFALGDVRLADDTPFASARDRMLHLARVYPVDRLLAVFRANAGLDTRGASAPGAWEDFGHPAEEAWGESDYPGRESAQTANLLRGHYAGHFLSMLSLAYAGERDEALKAKIDEFVAGLAEVQQALAATARFSHPGFLAAYGEWQFSRLEHYAPYGEIWAPYYTCHKIMAGLLDAYELAGSTLALDVVTAMGEWVSARLRRLDRGRLQKMWSLYIAGEFGGMNETMARLSVAADVPEFLDTARLFDQDDLIAAGTAGDDVLTGMHANQHLPQLVGYVHEYELTGDESYLAAAAAIWGQVVPGRMFAHGGTGESEIWGPPRTVAGNIGHRNAETCATYNLLKIARLLFLHTLDPRYMEYYERGVLNHILGSRRAADSDTSPEVTYMFPVHPGALPEFDNIGTCCGGTGLENHVKYQDSVFFRGTDADDELWVNLFVSSRLDWHERGVRVTLDSGLPLGTGVRLRFDRLDGQPGPTRVALRIRIPSWVSGPVRASIGGVEVPIDARPGEYARIEHPWNAGDALDLELPMALRAEGTVDDPTLRHLSFGPSVLAARSDRTTLIDSALTGRRDLDGSVRADASADPGAQLRAEGGVFVEGLRFEPVWTGGDDRYHMYLRANDPTLAFGGLDSGVPSRRGADGRSLLDDVWAEPAPRSRSDFLDRMLHVVSRARAGGLIGREESARVLDVAARAYPDGCPVRAGWVIDGSGSEPPLPGGVSEWIDDPRTAKAQGWTDVRARAGGEDVVVTVWNLADDSPGRAVPPTVEITTTPTPAATGWHVEPPTVSVTVYEPEAHDRAEPTLEIRVDDEEWMPFTGPFRFEREGVHRIHARATASSGLVSTSVTRLHVDTLPPATRAVVKPLGASVEISFFAADDTSGIERIQWEGPGTFWATFQEAFIRTLTDHEQIVEYAATDRAGNEEPRRRLVLPALTTGDIPV